MALAPKYAGQKWVASARPETLHTLELFLDYVCPFSKKMFDRIYDDVLPVARSKYPNKVQFILRQQIQPWHPSSTLVHEAGVAVLQTKPEKFWEFSKALFDKQTEYFDENVVNETRNKTYERLANLAGTVGVDSKTIYSKLEISTKPGKDGSLNVGNGVTDDLKPLVKHNRLQGIHVTPTVLFNGIVENGIGSSSSKQEWEEWLEKNIV
ncbi:hypothetical protein DOTSEDRAFT_71792 [Dothistroma septosporum NZE10]|uniref:Uncharacterized protein n=1 Tax=Dothistroma septosporum (strain NZE10 / CBS 128990) TaxID=675120 RepID=N1PNW1_DOTSN|nr:hypothetical protein DOTSEDRAFT_71792 [Dothistroma septosporum NZE10]